MKKQFLYISIALGFVLSLFKSTTYATVKGSDDLIQVAILLDVSNSMDGLINQAKSQLWKIVNEFALARRNGKIPQLEVALFEYGKSSLPSNKGYIRKIVPLSRDLDKISEELFKLNTNGGDEYCGMVIEKAISELEWTKDNNCIKAIFIAGNEPFTQGSVDYIYSCKNAISKGIVVNTIFCGNRQEGIETKWKDGADRADGMYTNIDQNQKIVHIDAPQDEEIKRLGMELNKTYISYGRKGVEKKKRQSAQDKKAEALASEVFVQRSVAKASKQYKNKSWDLVDASEDNEAVIENLKEAEMPEEIKDMNKKEQIKYIEGQREKREELQKKINALNEKRRKFIAKEQMKTSKKNTLDQAIITIVRKQAEKKNFKFK